MFLREKIPIKGSLDRYDRALTEVGYSAATRLTYLKQASIIVKRHENEGYEYFREDVFMRLSLEYDERLASGMERHYYLTVRRTIEMFSRFILTGSVEGMPNIRRGARQKLGASFQKIADRFIGGDFHPNTRGDIRWVTHKYFAWLERQGFSSLEDVGVLQIQKFLLSCSELYAPGTVHDIRVYLKKLYEYLYREGLSESNYREFLSFKVNREQRVFPTLPKVDIAKLLESIDRNTVKGKRDYAIMLMGTVLGLRACDVICLKLTDIDWMRGEIRIFQGKTMNTVILPLTQDVGEAVMDYILNARPTSPAAEVFLRVMPPFTALVSAVAVGEIYEDCCIAAGLPASKRFHDLRRTLGTSMVSNGVSVYHVAQVFGDRDVESTKPYLSADTEHLKMCALPFDGIAPKGGAGSA